MLMNHTNDVECKNCKSIFFTQEFLLKRISKFATAQEKDTIMPIPVFRCSNCLAPLDLYDETNPSDLIN